MSFRSRLQRLEKRLGSYERRKHVKVYIGLCPDDWSGGPWISVEEQLEQIKAGIRGYLCFETHEEATKWGYAKRISQDQFL